LEAIVDLQKQRFFLLGVGGALMLNLSGAQAQSSVTLYGQLDAGFFYSNKTIDPNTGGSGKGKFAFVNSGFLPSTFGITGSEDLGGGVHAKFNLESGIDMANGGFDNSNGNFFGREAWVGLDSSDYGEVQVGLVISPYAYAVFDLDPRSFAQFGGANLIYGNNSVTGFFVNNAINYNSPNIGGFSTSLMYSLGGVAGDFHAGKQYSANVKYQFGGLVLIAAIDDESESSDAIVDNTPFTTPLEAKIIGAIYNFSSFSLKASFSSYKAPFQLSEGVRSGGDNNVYNAGVSYYVTPSVDLCTSFFYIKDPHDSNNHAVDVSFSGQYFLSKSTSLYAEVGVTNNHGNEAIGVGLDGLFNAPQGTTIGAAVGMTHRF
jgi:predicted porin